MSIQAITAAFALEGVGPSEKLLLLALANYADENGRSYPSQKRLASDTGLSDRTIRRLLAEMADAGLLTRTERTRSDGSRSSDIITLTFPTQMSGGADTMSGGVRTQCPGGADMVSALTTFEPSSNQVRSEDLPQKTRASKRCHAEWVPKVETIQRLADEGYQPGQLERALTMIRDHQFPVARSDWDATFRNWVRNDRSIRPAGKPNVQHIPDQRQAAREDNYARAFAGAEAASRFRAVSG